MQRTRGAYTIKHITALKSYKKQMSLVYVTRLHGYLTSRSLLPGADIIKTFLNRDLHIFVLS